MINIVVVDRSEVGESVSHSLARKLETEDVQLMSPEEARDQRPDLYVVEPWENDYNHAAADFIREAGAPVLICSTQDPEYISKRFGLYEGQHFQGYCPKPFAGDQLAAAARDALFQQNI